MSGDVRPLRVAVNANSLYSPEIRGLSRYAHELMKHLTRQGVSLVLYARQPVHDSHLAALEPGRFEVRVAPPMKYAAWEQLWVPRQCRRDGVDLYHSPTNFGVPARCPVPRVLTLHDAIDSVYYQDRVGWLDWLRPGNARSRLMHQVARRSADHLLTVSRHAKADIVRRFGMPADRVTVVYEAADEAFARPHSPESARELRDRYRLARPYFFYVGGFEGRKNVAFLVRAFAAANSPDTELVCAGGGAGREALGALAAELGVGARVRFVGYVPDADLPGLYAGALGFAYASEYEGFGLQLVESMASSCPTLASDRTCLPEILGDGGETFPLETPDRLAGQLRRLAADPQYRADLAARGRRRAEAFSWAKCAAETLEVYRRTARAG